MNKNELKIYSLEHKKSFIDSMELCEDTSIDLIMLSVTAFELDSAEVFKKCMQYAHLLGITVQLLPPQLDYLIAMKGIKADA